MPESTPFADAIEQLRKAKGVTQAQMARDLNEYEGNISRWRRGGGIEHAKVRKLADYFEVDRAWLEDLAGYGDSEPSHARESIEAERQIWRARYDSLMEKTVPRWAWNAYMDACDALAEAFSKASPRQLNASDHGPLISSGGESGDSDPDGHNGDLSLTYRRRGSTQQIVERLIPAGA